MKKILITTMIIATILLVGCDKKEKNLEFSLSEIMDKVYEGIPEEQLPAPLANPEVTKENLSYYIGLDELDYKEILVSEPMRSSTAHSVVLIRLNDTTNIEQIKTDIKAKVNPRKWICVDVDEKNVYVDSIGDVIVLIMNNDIGKTMHDNFLALNK